MGDLVGFPSLASAAYMQGRAAAQHIQGNTDYRLDGADIPAGIYTSPEISSIGKTERELTDAKIPMKLVILNSKVWLAPKSPVELLECSRFSFIARHSQF